jgi:acetylornithine/N-succinyldiaminopimelate aminotransferase
MDLSSVKALDHSFLFQNYGRGEVCFDHGNAEFLYDLEGNEYLDLVAGIAVNALGHAHPAVVNALSDQVRRMVHVSNLYYIKEQAELARTLASVMPAELCRSMFVNSGTEANEAALKLVTKHTGRHKVISTKNSFHGRTSGSLAATGQPKYHKGFEPLLSQAFEYIDFNSVEQLKQTVDGETAAVILEPIQGEGGIIMGEREFFKTARDLCDDHHALLIMDEVQTGIGRTGKMFGFEHLGVVPDVVTLAKALGGGFPIGALVAQEEVSKAFGPGAHGTTFGGNPLGCAVAKAVLDTIVSEGLVDRSAEMGERWMARLSAPGVKVRGAGLMIGLEMDRAKEFQSHAFKDRVLVNVCGVSTLRLVPPLIVSETSMERFAEIYRSFLG